MNIKHIRWLHEELEQWREEGLISEEQSQRLQAKYGFIPKEGPSWTRLITVLGGAALILMGIILLFAGYWYGFSPNGRFDWSLVILLLAIAIVGGGVWKAKPASMVAEAITVIYMAILTTSTLLVADTYYTGEHMGLYVLIILEFLQSSFECVGRTGCRRWTVTSSSAILYTSFWSVSTGERPFISVCVMGICRCHFWRSIFHLIHL